MQSVLKQAGGQQEARADHLFTTGRLAEALALYRNVLQQDPGRLDIRARLGQLALLSNDPQQAITLLAAALNNGLRSRALWETLAEAYLANAEPASAALCYDRAGRNGLAGTLAVMADRELCRVEATADSYRFDWLPDVPLPVIRAEINGIPVNLLVDTAAGDLVLDEQVAVAAGIPHGGRESRYFAGGLPATVTYGHVERLQLGALAVHDLLTQILELQSRLAAYSPLVPIHGIIGVSVLSRFTVVLDFRRRSLVLRRAVPVATGQPDSASSDEIPFWIAANQFILVPAETPLADAKLWALDTGMAGAAFAMFSAAVDAAGLTGPGQGLEAGVGGGGTVEAQRMTLPRLRLGCLDRCDVDGMVLETSPLQGRFGFRTAGLLACDYFHNAVLSLDFSRMKLALTT